MGIPYSVHVRNEKLLHFGFDTLRELSITADIRHTQDDIKRVSRQACEAEKPRVITLAETGFGVRHARTRKWTTGSYKTREIS
jgi:hypothetical protein